MARTDMCSKAVTVRLVRTSQLRRLCLELRRCSNTRRSRPLATSRAADQIAGAVAEGREGYRGGKQRLDR
jgi:hypothetical protein